tara:strand:+ start:75 stop:551 length:477 start_codon:yes stop_codon:yes gene_type:complete
MKYTIYQISCNDDSIIDSYIGHTLNLEKRKKTHRNDCSTIKCQTRKLYSVMLNNGGFYNWTFTILNEYDCDKTQIKKFERDYIESSKPTLNQELPGRTTKEWQKNTYDKKANTEKMRLYRLQKFECPCGAVVTKPEKARHLKSEKHKLKITIKELSST